MKPLELQEYFDRFLDKFWTEHDKRRDSQKVPLIPYTASKNGVANGAGLINFEIYKNNTDRTFDITRAIVVSDTTSPAAPYTNAAGYFWFYFGSPGAFTPSTAFDFAPKVAGQQLYPYVNLYGKDTDPLLHPNESLSIVGVVAANVNITVTVSGYLTKAQAFH